jgi:methylglyoxal synthase
MYFMENLLFRPQAKTIAIISLNHKRQDLIEWTYDNKDVLLKQNLLATGTTADILEGTLNSPVTRLPSLITGGIAPIADMINDKKIDILILFYDTMKANKRNKHIAELMQLAINANTILAANSATATQLMSALRAEVDITKIVLDNKRLLQ